MLTSGHPVAYVQLAFRLPEEEEKGAATYHELLLAGLSKRNHCCCTPRARAARYAVGDNRCSQLGSGSVFRLQHTDSTSAHPISL